MLPETGPGWLLLKLAGPARGVLNRGPVAQIRNQDGWRVCWAHNGCNYVYAGAARGPAGPGLQR